MPQKTYKNCNLQNCAFRIPTLE